MNETAAGIYTIGQTPRPDLVENLAASFVSSRLEICGALDGMGKGEIPACGAGGYPLETRLGDGTRVVVDAAFVESRLQDAITRRDARVSAHLVLCAGPFPRLAASKPLVRPFDVAAAELAAKGFHLLEVLVPFAAQAAPSLRKWQAAGFSCRAHALTNTNVSSVAARLAERVSGNRADALVIDYVGLPGEILEKLRTASDIPLFDLGHLGVRALQRALTAPDRSPGESFREPLRTS